MSGPPPELIAAIKVATVQAPLPSPLVLGDWVQKHREFCLVRVDSESGQSGFAFTLTREGPVADVIRRVIAPRYTGRPIEPSDLFFRTQWTNNAILQAGLGLRSLSLVDLATWDLAARLSGRPMAEYLGGSASPMPVTAVVGYPPTLGGDGIHSQVKRLYDEGWRRFKCPIAPTPDLTHERLRAAASVAGDIELSLDAAWVFRGIEEAASFALGLPVNLGWLEDVFPPGNLELLSELRRRVKVPIAFGDDQGSPYFPDALIAAHAVDVVRVDATCMGGVTGLRPIIARCVEAGLRVSPHMSAHVHSQIFSGIGLLDVPIEWGVPGTGVDPFEDSLPQPTVAGGLMQPLPSEPGFGTLVNPAWLAKQQCADADHLVSDLIATHA